MPRKEKAYHFIYKTTCLITNRFYIGMHSTNDLEDGYLGSGKRLRRSVDKHGAENHQREILEFCEDRESLSKRESEIVNEQLLNDVLCMNLAAGGEGGFINTESARKGAIGMHNKVWKDKDYIERKRITMSKISTALWKTEEHKNKIISANKKRKGERHSEETKRKISESMSDKQKGERNSQFGTCWVTDGNKPIKIKREDLDHYLSIGYQRGRKM